MPNFLEGSPDAFNRISAAEPSFCPLLCGGQLGASGFHFNVLDRLPSTGTVLCGLEVVAVSGALHLETLPFIPSPYNGLGPFALSGVPADVSPRLSRSHIVGYVSVGKKELDQQFRFIEVRQLPAA